MFFIICVKVYQTAQNAEKYLDFRTRIWYKYNDKMHSKCSRNTVKIQRRKKQMQVTRESIIGDILDFDRGTAQFFFEIGMHCLGCPASRGESIEEACAVHGTDADELVEKINEYLSKQ